jgi:hypothetical protein
MILNLKDPKHSNKDEHFGKVAVYNVNMQKSIAFSYTNNQ